MAKKIDIEAVILAHKFTCPYYSPTAKAIGLSPPAHCGARDVLHQIDCTGQCWYMSHFKELIKGLVKEAALAAPCK